MPLWPMRTAGRTIGIFDQDFSSNIDDFAGAGCIDAVNGEAFFVTAEDTGDQAEQDGSKLG